MSDLTALARKALQPYHDGNKNTGNVYEICFILYILRRMGLTNADIDSLADYFATIRSFNPKFTEAYVAHLKTTAVGRGLTLEGRALTDIRNVTQDDSDGGTGDFIFILDDGSERSVSVEEGSPARDGSISKCLSNPSCKRFGCTDEMITDFKRAALVAVDEFKAEMSAKHGADMNAWPARTKTAAQNKAISYIATKTRDHFNGLAVAAQKAILEDIMGVSGGKKPADYLGLVPTSLKTFSLWSFGSLRVDPAAYHLSLRGDYLEVVSRADPADVIGKTQVKFNNGVWKKGKDGIWRTSSATSSWNGNFTLSKVFEMGRVSV